MWHSDGPLSVLLAAPPKTLSPRGKPNYRLKCILLRACLSQLGRHNSSPQLHGYTQQCPLTQALNVQRQTLIPLRPLRNLLLPQPSSSHAAEPTPVAVYLLLLLPLPNPSRATLSTSAKSPPRPPLLTSLTWPARKPCRISTRDQLPGEIGSDE